MGHHHESSPSPPPAPRMHHSPDLASSESAATAISRAKKRQSEEEAATSSLLSLRFRSPIFKCAAELTNSDLQTTPRDVAKLRRLSFLECSGKYCRSCSASMIADCVALCCCPCALVNLLTLALVKVPWMVGRRCLGFRQKQKEAEPEPGAKSEIKKWKSNKKKNLKHCSGGGSSSQRQRRCAVEEELPAQISGYVFGFNDGEEEEEEEEDCVSSAERVWLELYQVGHLGFGRVSFSGGAVQSVQGKGSLGT